MIKLNIKKGTNAILASFFVSFCIYFLLLTLTSLINLSDKWFLGFYLSFWIRSLVLLFLIASLILFGRMFYKMQSLKKMWAWTFTALSIVLIPIAAIYSFSLAKLVFNVKHPDLSASIPISIGYLKFYIFIILTLSALCPIMAYILHKSPQRLKEE